MAHLLPNITSRQAAKGDDSIMKNYQERIENYKEYMEVMFADVAQQCEAFPMDDRGGFYRSYQRVMKGIDEAAGLKLESRMLERAIFEQIRKEIQALEDSKASMKKRSMIA